MNTSFTSIDDYIFAQPQEYQAMLEKVRATIRKAAPTAEEYIGYGMPGYKLNGPLVYFALFTHHLGFYATPAGHEEFKEELSRYKQGKGSVQFPLDKAIPYALITRIVKFRVMDNEQKALEKKTKKK